MRAEINKYDMMQLKRKLDEFEPKLRKKWARQSLRRAQRVHILPQVRRAIPSGASGSRGRSIHTAGNREKGHLQEYAVSGKRSTGKLRRSFKVAATKRSRKTVGANTVSYDQETFYMRWVEKGRTFNKFLPMRLWRKVPDSDKEFYKGRHFMKKVGDRRGERATKSAMRGIWDRIRIEMRERKLGGRN